MRLVAGALIAVLAATATAAPKKPVPKKLLRYADTIGVKDLERREKPREGAIETYLGRYREGGALLPSARRPALRDGDKLFLHVLPGGTMRVESRRHATNGKRHVHRLDGSYRGLEAGTWWPFVAADLGLEMSGGGFYRPEVPGGLADHGPILRGIVRDPAALTRAGIAGVRAGHRIELERPAGRETDWKLRILEVAARVSPRSGPLSERGGWAISSSCARTAGWRGSRARRGTRECSTTRVCRAVGSPTGSACHDPRSSERRRASPTSAGRGKTIYSIWTSKCGARPGMGGSFTPGASSRSCSFDRSPTTPRSCASGWTRTGAFAPTRRSDLLVAT
jgi:hypothetical protein